MTLTQEELQSYAVTNPKEDDIRLRAYQLYELRGREDGRADEDWYQAEAELLEQTPEKKAA